MGLLLLLLLLGWFPPREDGKGALNVVVVSGTLSGLDVCVAAEGLLMGLCAADGVEGGGEGDYCRCVDLFCLLFTGFPSLPRKLQTQPSKVPLALMRALLFKGVAVPLRACVLV